MKILRILMMAAGAAAFATPALAEHPGHGHGKGHKHHDESGQDEDRNEDRGDRGDRGDHGRREFDDNERDQIRGFYRDNPEERERLPPGLAKKNKIPPGWEKKIGRGQRIPDDIWVQRVPVPREVVLKLPVPPPPGVVLVRVQDHVLRVIEKTHEVLDDLGLPHPPTPRISPPR